MSENDVKVEVDRRNWFANNVIQLATVVVLGISAIAVSRYKLGVYDSFMVEQASLNKEVAKQVSDLAYTVDKQAALQERTNEYFGDMLKEQKKTNEANKRLLIILEDRASHGRDLEE